jgi:hypothetical protein
MKKVRRIVVGVTIVVLLTLILFIQKASWKQTAEFRHGSTLKFMGVTIGTNSFQAGSPLSKLLGNIIPVQGISFGPVRLFRPYPVVPSGEPDLTAWLLVTDARLRPNDIPYYWEGSSVLVTSASGRTFRNPPLQPYLQKTNEWLLGVPLHAFPRDQKNLILRIRPRASVGEAEQWAEFHFENPLLTKPVRWSELALPQTNHIGEISVALLEAKTSPPSLRFLLPSAEWTIAECQIVDEEGNRFSSNRKYQPGRRTIVGEFDYSLETNRTWKAQTTLVRASMDEGEPKPDYPSERQMLITLNSGPDVHVTNQLGEKYIFRFSGGHLYVRPEGQSYRPHLVVLGATNEIGAALRFHELTATWAAFPGWPRAQQAWFARAPATNITVLVAFPEIVRTEFCFRPQ